MRCCCCCLLPADSNGRDSLSVYFKPTYWGLNQGAAVDVSNCFSANVPVSRKLMQTSTLVTTNGTVSGCTVEFNGASAASVSADADGVFNHTFSRNSLAAVSQPRRGGRPRRGNVLTPCFRRLTLGCVN